MNHRQQSVWMSTIGCVTAPLWLLLVPIIPFLTWLGWNKLNAKPRYVIEYLEKFIARSEGGWDWDDFCSVPLTDPALDEIRERACGLWKPDGLTSGDFEELRALLNEARSLEMQAH